MSISQNFPAIRPSLLLDFANTERLDPRITFTRTTTATYYDGVTTAKAEENLLLRSQDYSATWTVTNLTPVTGKTAPDGTSTATEFTAGAANAVLTQGYTAIAGSYTFSVWLRRVTGTGDIQIAADNGTWTTKVITGTWARYDVTQTVAAGSKTAGVRVVTSGDAIEVWGAQLEQRSAVTAYTPTTTQAITNYIPVLKTAASGVARFDHNPTTGESLGLLVEEQRTNLATYSDDFADASWSKVNSSITSNTIVAPNGTLTGDKLVEDATASVGHYVTNNFSVTSGTSYAASVYAKAGERTAFQIILLSSGFGTNVIGAFDLSNGVSTAAGGTASSSLITPVGNGWYRCTVIAQATATTSTSQQIRTASTYSASSPASYTGNGYSGIYIWGAQLEAGAFPTSYIPTVAATVTRNADAASMTGTNFSSWFNNAEGTFYVDFNASPAGTTGLWRVFSLNSSNRPQMFNNSGSYNWEVSANGSSAGPAPVANAPTKFAGVYKTNDVIGYWNGTAGTADTSVTLDVVTAITIGGANATANRELNNCIKKLAYYPIRVTNAQLQALTS